MDFIERIFGVSPDGGSGSLETAYFAVAVVAIAVFLYRGARKRAERRRTSDT